MAVFLVFQEQDKRKRAVEAYRKALQDMKKKALLGGPDYEVSLIRKAHKHQHNTFLSICEMIISQTLCPNGQYKKALEGMLQ